MKKLKKAIRLLEVLKAGVGGDEWGWAINYALKHLRLKEKAGSIEKVGVEDIEKNIKIMSDEKIEKAPNPEYAGAYNQGKFDVLMEIKRLNNLKEKE